MVNWVLTLVLDRHVPYSRWSELCASLVGMTPRAICDRGRKDDFQIRAQDDELFRKPMRDVNEDVLGGVLNQP
jgi:hypothetical protein